MAFSKAACIFISGGNVHRWHARYSPPRAHCHISVNYCLFMRDLSPPLLVATCPCYLSLLLSHCRFLQKTVIHKPQLVEGRSEDVHLSGSISDPDDRFKIPYECKLRGSAKAVGSSISV
jgi:hypothetical protein